MYVYVRVYIYVCICVCVAYDTGRLTKEQIERMVADAEKFKDEDKKQQERITAKNKLEQYVYAIRSTITGTHQHIQHYNEQTKQNTSIIHILTESCILSNCMYTHICFVCFLCDLYV